MDEEFLQKGAGGNTNRDAPGGGNSYVTAGLGSTEESARFRHQNERQEDAEQRSGGSQESAPHERELLRILRSQSGQKTIDQKDFEQGKNAMNPEGTVSGIDVYSEEAPKTELDAEDGDQTFYANGTQVVQG